MSWAFSFSPLNLIFLQWHCFLRKKRSKSNQTFISLLPLLRLPFIIPIIAYSFYLCKHFFSRLFLLSLYPTTNCVFSVSFYAVIFSVDIFLSIFLQLIVHKPRFPPCFLVISSIDLKLLLCYHKKRFIMDIVCGTVLWWFSYGREDSDC